MLIRLQPSVQLMLLRFEHQNTDVELEASLQYRGADPDRHFKWHRPERMEPAKTKHYPTLLVRVDPKRENKLVNLHY